MEPAGPARARAWTWGLSLGLHALAAGALTVYFVFAPPAPPAVAEAEPTPPAPSTAAGADRPAEALPEGFVAKDDGERERMRKLQAVLGDRIGRTVAAAARQSEKENFRAAADGIERLEKISSAKSMHEIGAMVRQTVKAGQRHYAPVANLPKGDFDHPSALVHKIVVKTAAGSAKSKFYLLVDRNGRTMEVPIPPEEDGLAVQTLEKLQQSSVLAAFKDQVLLPVLGGQVNP